MKSLKDLPLNNFVEILSTDAPTPAGGSTAALGASLAASLTIKGYNIILKRENDSDLLKRRDELIEVRDQLIQLIDNDAQAFEKFFTNLKITGDIKDIKSQKLLVEATEIPLKIVKLGLIVLDYLEAIYERSPASISSDLNTAKAFVNASLNSALDTCLANIEDIGITN